MQWLLVHLTTERKVNRENNLQLRLRGVWRPGQYVLHLSPRDNWDGLQGRNCGSYVQIIFQDDGSYIAPLFNTKYDFIMPDCP